MNGADNFCRLPYDPEWRALKWARENCPSYITNCAAPTQLKYFPNYDTDRAAPNRLRTIAGIDYYFADREELTLFTLKWKTNG